MGTLRCVMLGLQGGIVASITITHSIEAITNITLASYYGNSKPYYVEAMPEAY